MPLLHGTHAVRSLEGTLGDAQAAHRAPAVGFAVPGKHALQTVELSPPARLTPDSAPLAHGVHAVAFWDAYVPPAGHAAHARAPARSAMPGLHTMAVHAVAPGAEEVKPAGQSVHAADPAAEEK